MELAGIFSAMSKAGSMGVSGYSFKSGEISPLDDIPNERIMSIEKFDVRMVVTVGSKAL